MPSLNRSTSIQSHSRTLLNARVSIALALSIIVLFAIGGVLAGSSCCNNHHSAPPSCAHPLWVAGLAIISLAGVYSIASLVLLLVFLLKRNSAESGQRREDSQGWEENAAAPLYQVQNGELILAPHPCEKDTYDGSPQAPQPLDPWWMQRCKEDAVEIMTPVETGSVCAWCGIVVLTPFCSGCGAQIVNV